MGCRTGWKQISKSRVNIFSRLFQIYIEDRLLITFSVLLKSLVQIVIVILALYACVSRVSDNRHHVSDVVAGGFLGIIVALYTVSLSLADPRGKGSDARLRFNSMADSGFARGNVNLLLCQIFRGNECPKFIYLDSPL